MSLNDRIGNHGELVFQTLISRSCRGRFYFRPIHMGEKHPSTDIVVELFDPTDLRSVFFIQVKSTTLGYTGKGSDEKLRVKISASDIELLKKAPGPAYVAGIDINRGRGYLSGIVSSTEGAINGLPTRHPIICQSIRKLWTEVDAHWSTEPRSLPMTSTVFGI
jgi:hypothetical protein